MVDNTLGTVALTALCVDAVVLGKKIADAAADGIQYTDTFALVSAFPQMRDIALNAKQAFKELKDLTPDEAQDLVVEVSRRAQLPSDETTLGKVRATLALCARSYKFVDDTFDEGKAIVHQWGDLLNISRLQGDGLQA